MHGEEYEQAHHIYREQRQQQGPSSGAARLLQAVKARQEPNSRLQKLLQDNQASTLRIQPVYQLDGGYLSSQQAAQVRDVLVPGAIRVLQQYIKVRSGTWCGSCCGFSIAAELCFRGYAVIVTVVAVTWCIPWLVVTAGQDMT